MSNLEKILEREEKLKKEQAKLRQQKKRALEKEDLQLAKAVKQYFGFKSMGDFEYYVTENGVQIDDVVIPKEDYHFFKSIVDEMTQQNGNYRLDRDSLQSLVNELYIRVNKWQ